MTNAIIKLESTKQLIWDLPIRVWHWLLTGALIGAAVISLALGEHSSLFPYHSILGLVMGLMVVLRIIWAFVGTRHARLASLAFPPGSLLSYLRGTIHGGAPRFAGHNPGAAYATIAMLVLILVIAGSGVALAQGVKGVKEIHELSVYALLGVAGLHIVGVIAHTIRHREPIALSMIHGKKLAAEGDGIRTSRPLAALLFLAFVGGWAFMLARAYDPTTQSTTIPFTSVTLALGEAEGEDGARHEGAQVRDSKSDQREPTRPSQEDSHEEREDDDD